MTLVRKNGWLTAFYLLVCLAMLAASVNGIRQGNIKTAAATAASIAILALPAVMEKRRNISISVGLEVMMVFFMFGSVFLGDVGGLYTRFIFWDTFLHTLSGVIIALVGLSIVRISNENTDARVLLSPFQMALFAFCLSVTLAVFWEFYEFFMDQLFSLNMQKDTLLADGTLDIGLLDTMEDMLVGTLGALIVCVIGYLCEKHRRWNALSSFLITSGKRAEASLPSPKASGEPGDIDS